MRWPPNYGPNTPTAKASFSSARRRKNVTVYRTEKRYNPKKNTSYAWIVKSTALVNQYYFYCVDQDFGPFLLKFCSYFPYNAKLCLKWARIRKTSTRPGGYRLRGPRQRHSLLAASSATAIAL